MNVVVWMNDSHLGLIMILVYMGEFSLDFL